ncbi:hypothetical protein SPHINGO391_360105 [Sphingomonas aurantiaca]|uniref:Uncharacterized protein n=1 Tax=Sphingomonas aurantiaca TaxID=185949 RepID=A0A5E7YFA2_9SPHN|nr:hypothetical protein SPHINGO391_360105 [Sphingomonas aurantiaca]
MGLASRPPIGGSTGWVVYLSRVALVRLASADGRYIRRATQPRHPDERRDPGYQPQRPWLWVLTFVRMTGLGGAGGAAGGRMLVRAVATQSTSVALASYAAVAIVASSRAAARR